MCFLCELKTPLDRPKALHTASADPAYLGSHRASRRGFLMAAAGMAALPVSAQVDVGKPSIALKFASASKLEQDAAQQFAQMKQQASSQQALLPNTHPQLQRLHGMAQRIIPFTESWNKRAKSWKWEVVLIQSDQINAFCMPGGKIAFYTGILDKLKLTDDEAAMIMGHEMAHALREHAAERMVKTNATSLGSRLLAQAFGLGDLGNVAADLGTQLLSLTYSRENETEADLVGLELAARAAYVPSASVSLWQKMSAAGGGKDLAFLSTHPSGPDRIKQLQANLPKVQGLYEAARKRG
jgi:Zn-dependent protease with chaperone function